MRRTLTALALSTLFAAAPAFAKSHVSSTKAVAADEAKPADAKPADAPKTKTKKKVKKSTEKKEGEAAPAPETAK